MGLRGTAEGIRAAREHIMSLPAGHEFRSMLQYDDFYSASMVRDMLFHVQEHVFTVAGIRDLLEGTGLRLMGFVNLSPEAVENLKSLFPEEIRRDDLSAWEKLENAFPGSFTGMYKFWCEKV